MGDIKRRRKLFSRPRKPFDSKRMQEENILVEKYGLKNKKEIWKAVSKASKMRRQAKELIGKSETEQREFFERLNKMGLNVVKISDVLAIRSEDLFERRLQTVVFKKKLASTPKQARQFITHKKVLVNGRAVNIPSFIVTRNLEDKISLKTKRIKAAKIATQEEAVATGVTQ